MLCLGSRLLLAFFALLVGFSSGGDTCPIDAAYCKPGHKLHPWPGVAQTFTDDEYKAFRTWKDVPWTFDLDSVPCTIKIVDMNNEKQRREMVQNVEKYRVGTASKGVPVLIRNADSRNGKAPYNKLQNFKFVYHKTKNIEVPTYWASRNPHGPYQCLTVGQFWREKEKGRGLNGSQQIFAFDGAEHHLADDQKCSYRIDYLQLGSHWVAPWENYRNFITEIGFRVEPRLHLSPDVRGLPFHHHGSVINERLSGRKLWMFYGYETNLASQNGMAMIKKMNETDNGRLTALSWTLEDLPKLKADSRPHVCLQKPGEILLLPDDTLHHTLNIGDGHQIAY